METTPLTAQALSNALKMLGWSQLDLAQKSNIQNSAVSLQISGKRPVRDDHLAAYCQVLPPTETILVFAAWCRDTLPEQARAILFDPSGKGLAEDVKSWAPSLEPELAKMLDWLASQLSTDKELAEVFRILCHRGGYSE